VSPYPPTDPLALHHCHIASDPSALWPELTGHSCASRFSSSLRRRHLQQRKPPRRPPEPQYCSLCHADLPKRYGLQTPHVFCPPANRIDEGEGPPVTAVTCVKKISAASLASKNIARRTSGAMCSLPWGIFLAHQPPSSRAPSPFDVTSGPNVTFVVKNYKSPQAHGALQVSRRSSLGQMLKVPATLWWRRKDEGPLWGATCGWNFFPCPHCGKEFTRSHQVDNHMRMSHRSLATIGGGSVA